jgi:hypothetical protein
MDVYSSMYMMCSAATATCSSNDVLGHHDRFKKRDERIHAGI